jgi:hypothetical protein
MLHQQLSNAWRFRERAFPISPVLTLKPEGLVLGAGTVVLPTEESRRLKSVDGDECVCWRCCLPLMAGR